MLGLTTNLALLRAIAAEPRFAAGATHTGYLDETRPLARAEEQPIPPEVLIAAVLADDAQTRVQPDPFARLWRAGGYTCRRRYETAGGVIHHVALRDGSGTVEARVDDQTLAVEVVARWGSALTLRFGARSERFVVEANGRRVVVQRRGTQYRLLAQAGLSVDQLRGSGTAAHGHTNLEAPMSGTVIKVLVEEGQTVAAGEALLVLEAMKMEHTITAPYAGVVSRVHYRAGQLASGGTPLVEIESQP